MRLQIEDHWGVDEVDENNNFIEIDQNNNEVNDGFHQNDEWAAGNPMPAAEMPEDAWSQENVYTNDVVNHQCGQQPLSGAPGGGRVNPNWNDDILGGVEWDHGKSIITKIQTMHKLIIYLVDMLKITALRCMP